MFFWLRVIIMGFLPKTARPETCILTLDCYKKQNVLLISILFIINFFVVPVMCYCYPQDC